MSDELRDEPIMDSVREAWITYTASYQSPGAACDEFDRLFEAVVVRRVADAKAEALKRIAETDAKLADAERTLVELMPDAVLVEGSWIPVAEWPKILGNFMRSTADYARQWKDAEVARADAEKWRHDVANGTGYLIPETGEWANAAMIVEAFNDHLMWARDLPEWQERAEVAEARIAKAVEILSWMPEHDGDDLGRVEDDYRHRAQLADEALTALVAVGREGESHE